MTFFNTRIDGRGILLIMVDGEISNIGMGEAIRQAKASRSEGGIPIGSALLRGERIIGSGHNRRVQLGNPILHGEMDCLQNAGRQKSYRDTVIYSTLMPCYMCAGTIVQFNIPIVVVGESRTFQGGREFLDRHSVQVIDLDDEECREIMEKFILSEPELWFEDIGS
jgi:cytosine deaminase